MDVEAAGNVVAGNLIGTNTSRANLGNVTGVFVGVGGSTIGGITASAANVIAFSHSGGTPQSGSGVYVYSATGAVVVGNFIGTDASGADLGNTARGILIYSGGNNTIGGSVAGAGNQIAFNSTAGVQIGYLGGSTGNVVLGNYIGTNASGAKLGNGGPGVLISDVSNNTIGGAGNAANTIGFNSDGIDITGPTRPATWYRATSSAPTSPAQAPWAMRTTVSSSGVGASANMIGGTAAGSGNVIAFNTGAAVTVDSGTGNAIRQNSIFANGQGIVLVNGGNANQPAPTLTAATSVPNLTTVQGQLSGFTANAQFALEFFASTAGDPPIQGEAHVFLGNATVLTDASGAASFLLSFAATVPAGQVITAKATSPANNTSVLALSTGLSNSFVVTTSANDGVGSLRQAILNADR